MEEKIIKNALDLYGIAEHQLIEELSGGTYNTVYQFEQDGEQFVIRVGEIEFDIETTNGMIAWLKFLLTNGAAVPELVNSVQDHPVEYIQSGDRTYSVDVTRKISGENARTQIIENQDMSWARAFGQAIGKIHHLAGSRAPESVLRVRPHWDQLGSDFIPPVKFSDEEVEIKKRRAEILNRIQEFPKTPDVYGLVHGDLHLGNILVQPGSSTITLLDFDDVCFGWFMMDLVAPITDIWVCYSGEDKAGAVNRYLSEALAGYQLEARFSLDQQSQIPLLLDLLEIGLYTRLHKIDISQLENGWVKTFMTDRKERIEAGIPFVEIQESAFEVKRS